MYSEEIKRLIEQRNYLISIKEYIGIIRSPQVDHVIYKNQEFNIWTTDGYKFKLQIRKER
ncbi:MAG: hypothetical protein IKE89_03440 [Bacilli bacterium]|nr:hypothetical protein [Bacilli bacterium]MBR2711505.1 hypothetical protein [Bacilli bacterium]